VLSSVASTRTCSSHNDVLRFLVIFGAHRPHGAPHRCLIHHHLLPPFPCRLICRCHRRLGLLYNTTHSQAIEAQAHRPIVKPCCVAHREALPSITKPSSCRSTMLKPSCTAPREGALLRSSSPWSSAYYHPNHRLIDWSTNGSYQTT
jgi:hypothetical protein